MRWLAYCARCPNRATKLYLNMEWHNFTRTGDMAGGKIETLASCGEAGKASPSSQPQDGGNSMTERTSCTSSAIRPCYGVRFRAAATPLARQAETPASHDCGHDDVVDNRGQRPNGMVNTPVVSNTPRRGEGRS